MNSRALLVVLLFSCLLTIHPDAQAQVVVTSHTNIENGVIAPLCRTQMQDADTQVNYAQAYAICTLKETSQNLPTSVIESWNCHGRFDAKCDGLGVNSVDAGATYETDGDHELQLVPFAGCAGCYFDPLGYVTAPIPIFPDSGTLPFGQEQVPSAASPIFLIAKTIETPFIAISVLPSSFNARVNDAETFTADRTSQWTFTGAGTIDSSTPLVGDHVLYHAPASIATESIDQLTACDLEQNHQQNCTTVLISLHPLDVKVTGLKELFPSQEGSTQPPYIASVSAVSAPVSTTINWSVHVSDTSLANLVTPLFTTTAARLQIAPTSQVTVPFDITLQACAQLDPIRCGSIPIHVPVSRVTLDQPTGTDFILDQSGQPIFEAKGLLTFNANVSGPVLPEDLKPRWGIVPVPLGPNPGTIATDPTSDFRGLYAPPAPPITQRLNVTIKACVGGVESVFDPTLFADEICGFYLLQLAPPTVITTNSLIVNSGEATPITIIGTGFGPAPTISFADPNINFVLGSISVPDSAGKITITGTVTIPPIPTTELTTLTLTSSLPPPTTPANQPFRVNGVNLTPTITPASATLLVTQSQQFTPSLSCMTAGGQSCTVPQTFTCSVLSGFGVMNASTCVYTAGSSLSRSTPVTLTGQACSTFGNKCVSFPITVNPVAISVSPASAALDSGQSQAFQATVTNSPNNNQSTNWSISPAVGSISATGLYTAPAVVASLQTVTVTGCSAVDTSHCASATVTLNPVTVAITPSAPVTLSHGQTQQFQATVTHTTNTGVVWSISPAVGSISATGLYTAPASITGNQTAVVKACTSIAPSNCASSNVNLIPPDFALSVSPNSGPTGLGFRTSFDVFVAPIGGFGGIVTFSATVPAGIGMTPTFSPATITASGFTVAQFSVLSSTPEGTYPVTITGTSGSVAHSIQITVTVVAESITVTASAPQTAAAGTTVTFTFFVTNNGFIAAGDGIDVTGIPPGSTVIPTATTGGIGAVTVEFTTATTLAPGTYPITYTASDGSLTGSATTSLTIPAPPPPPPPPPPRCTTRDCLNQ